MTDDNLTERLDRIEEQTGVESDAPLSVVYIGETPPAEYTVCREPGESDPIDRVEKAALPKFYPPGYRRIFLILTCEDIVDIWDSMPAELRQRERELRRENDEPIPPILEESND